STGLQNRGLGVRAPPLLPPRARSPTSGQQVDWYMAKVTPAQFVRQVRQEVGKVTWPSRKETGVSTLMVFVMVVLAALFFLVVDQIFAMLVRVILQLGG